MNATLNLIANILAYGDVGTTSNPQRRYVDWSINRSYQVANAKAEAYVLAPGASLTVFSGTRTTAIDNTTQFQMALSTLSSTRYRFTWTAVGTAPALRTDRGINLATHVITMTANSNSTLTMASGTAADFAAVQAGDTIFIPDVTTGDAASPFNPLNTGYWVVMSVTNNQTLQLARPSGSSFSGVSEVVTPSLSTSVWAFSAAGVQVGDSVNINAGFDSSIQGTYQVVAVTSKWFEVIATQPLPTTETALPTASGMIFYTSAKRYLRVEVDQAAVLRLNGATDNTNMLAPWSPADPDNTATYEKVGPCWQAVVVNQSQTASLNLLVISAE